MKRLFVLSFLAGLFLSTPAFSQLLRWKPVTEGFGPLPASIRLFKTTDSLDGHPFIGYYISAVLEDPLLNFTAQTGEGVRYTPSQYFNREDSPLVVVNGGFFSPESNRNLNLVIRKGKLVAYNFPALKSKFADSFYYPTYGAIGITRDRRADVAWTFTDSTQRRPYAFEYNPVIAKGDTAVPTLKSLNTLEQWKRWHMWTAVGGGPVLVQKGQVRITNREEQRFVDSSDDRHPRTAMGYTRDGRLIILVIQGRSPGIAEGANLLEEAEIMIHLGCVEALNLDGDDSSCLLVNGHPTILPSGQKGEQAVPSVFIIGWK